MKMNPTFIGRYAALVAALSATELFGSTFPPPVSSLEITRTNALTTRVKVLDAYDQVWTLQSSGDLKTWSDVETFKIHNGSIARSFTRDAANPNLFFRAAFTSANQDIPSTVESALRLPASSWSLRNPY